MKSLVIELRAGEVKEPQAQALLETSAAVIGGLIKAFDDYERRSEIEQLDQETRRGLLRPL
jgi:hypothetical protein